MNEQQRKAANLTRGIFDQKDPRSVYWVAEWKRIIANLDYDKHDAVVMDNNSMVDYANELCKYAGLETFTQPALKEFVVKVICDNCTVSVYFRPCVAPKSGVVREDTNGEKLTFYTHSDAFVSFDGGENVNAVLSVCYGIPVDEDTESIATHVWTVYKMDTPVEHLRAIEDTVATFFVTAQSCLRNRPEMFAEETLRVTPDTTDKPSKKNTKNKRGKTKMVRVIRLKKEYRKTGRHMEKDCWTVIAHDRHYKNGTVVRIPTYRKGKKRHDPNALCPKDYVPADQNIIE